MIKKHSFKLTLVLTSFVLTEHPVGHCRVDYIKLMIGLATLIPSFFPLIDPDLSTVHRGSQRLHCSQDFSQQSRPLSPQAA